MPAEKGFFASLFDLSFSSLITTKIIKALYVLTLIALGLGYLVFTLAAFQSSSGLGIFVLLIGGPLGFLFYAIWSRVSLEIVVAVFRIMETNVEIAAHHRTATSAAAPGTAPPASPTGV